MSTFTIEALLKASGGSQFEQAFKNAEGAMGKFKQSSEKMKSTGKTLTKKLTLPIVGFGTAAVATVSKFDDSMANVQKISGATGKDFDLLRKKAEKLGQSTAFSASEAADGMGILAASGMKTVDILSTTGPMFDLMSAGSIDAEVSARILTNTMSQFNLEATESAAIADAFASGSSNAKVSVEELEVAMAKAGGGLANMNMSAEESVAVMGHLANAAIPVGELGSTVNAMTTDIIKNAEEMSEYAQVYDKSTGRMRGMDEILGDLEESLKGKTQEEKNAILQTLFTSKALRGVNGWLTRGTDKYNELTKAMAEQEDAAASMAATQEDTLGGAFRGLSSAVEGLMIQVGDIAKGPIGSLTKKLTTMATKFGELSEPMQKAIIIFGLIIAAIGPLLMIIGQIGLGITALSTVLPILMGPVGLVIAIFAALVAAGVLIYKNWDTIKEKAIAIWTSIKDFFTETIPEMINNIKEWFGQLPERIGEIWDNLIQKTIDWGKSMGEKAVETGRNFINSIVEFFETLPERVGYFIGYTLASIVKWGMDMWEKAKETGSNFIEGTVEFFQTLPSRVKTWLDNTITNISNWGINMKEKATTSATDFVNKTIEFIKQLPERVSTWLTETIKKVTSWGVDLKESGVKGAKDLVTGIIETVINLPQRMKEVGTDLVKGLWSGISGAKDWVTDKVNGFMGGILKGAKDVFGVKSPSREFMSIGKYLDEGLIKGILGGASKVQNTMDRVMESIIPRNENNIVFDINGRIAESNGQVTSAVSHEINQNAGTKESLVMYFKLGNRDYKAFVEDISNAQSKDIHFEEVYGL